MLVPPIEGVSYLWSTGDTTNILYPSKPGIYSVIVSNDCGSLDTTYTVAGDECLQTIYIPNSFTPNGDGVNDFWFVEGNNIRVKSIQIFNRWGDKIYESNDASIPWIGQVHGGNYYAQDGVYAYKVVYSNTDNNVQEKNGHITLIR